MTRTLLLLVLATVGCTSDRAEPAAAPPAARAPKATAGGALTSSDEGRREKGRAQLWAENCIRCHNARPSTYYSDGEWTIAMHHMRYRGYLTAREHEAILEFLKATKSG